MRCCPSRQCRNDNKKHRSTCRRLMCPRARSSPLTRARVLLMRPRACPRRRKQAQLLLRFARHANKDAQRGRSPGGACSERLRSAERQGTDRFIMALPTQESRAGMGNRLDLKPCRSSTLSSGCKTKSQNGSITLELHSVGDRKIRDSISASEAKAALSGLGCLPLPARKECSS